MQACFTIEEGLSYDLSLRAAKTILSLAQRYNKTIIIAENGLHYSFPWKKFLNYEEQKRVTNFHNIYLSSEAELRHTDKSFYDYYYLSSSKIKHRYKNTKTTLILLDSNHSFRSDFIEFFSQVFIFGKENFITENDIAYLPYIVSSNTKSYFDSNKKPHLLLIGNGYPEDTLHFLNLADGANIKLSLFDPYFSLNDYTIKDERIKSIYRHYNSISWANDFHDITCCVSTNRFIGDDIGHFACELYNRDVSVLSHYLKNHKYWNKDNFQDALSLHIKETKNQTPKKTDNISTVNEKYFPDIFFNKLEKIKNEKNNYKKAHYNSFMHHTIIYSSVRYLELDRNRPQQYIWVEVHSQKWIEFISFLCKSLPDNKKYVLLLDKHDVFMQLKTNKEVISFKHIDFKFIKNKYLFIREFGRAYSPSLLHILAEPHDMDDFKNQLDCIEYIENKKKSTKPYVFIMGFLGESNTHSVSTKKVGIQVAAEILLNEIHLNSDIQVFWTESPDFSLFTPRAIDRELDCINEKNQSQIDFFSFSRLIKQSHPKILLKMDPYVSTIIEGRNHNTDLNRLPIVSFLHSTSAGSLYTDTVLSYLNGGYQPGDAIISPTQCAKKSYFSMWEYVHGYFQHQHQRLPEIEVIPYGIPLNVSEFMHPVVCRHYLNLPSDKIILTSLGRITPQDKSDLMPLIYAFYELQKKNSAIHLVIAGSTGNISYTQQLENLISELGIADRVSFFLNVHVQQKKFILYASDIFISLSDNIQETYSISILEAMSHKLPIIANNWNGYREIVEHGKTGFLIDTYMGKIPEGLNQTYRIDNGGWAFQYHDIGENVAISLEKLIFYLEKLIQNPFLRKSMGEQALRKVQDDFCSELQSRKIVDFLLEKIKEFSSGKQMQLMQNKPLVPYSWEKHLKPFPYPNTVIAEHRIQRIPAVISHAFYGLMKRFYPGITLSKYEHFLNCLDGCMPKYPKSEWGSVVYDHFKALGYSAVQIDRFFIIALQLGHIAIIKT